MLVSFQWELLAKGCTQPTVISFLHWVSSDVTGHGTWAYP